MNTTTQCAALERRKAARAMKNRIDGLSSQEGNRARIKRIREQGRITVTVRGVVSVLMDGANESELFAAYVEKDAYSIGLATEEEASDVRVSA